MKLSWLLLIGVTRGLVEETSDQVYDDQYDQRAKNSLTSEKVTTYKAWKRNSKVQFSTLTGYNTQYYPEDDGKPTDEKAKQNYDKPKPGKPGKPNKPNKPNKPQKPGKPETDDEIESLKRIDRVFTNINQWIRDNASKYKKKDKLISIVARYALILAKCILFKDYNFASSVRYDNHHVR